MAAVEDTLDRGITALALDINADQRQAMLAYLDLLQRWNRAYNLTAVRDPLEMVTRHLLDSLSIAPYLSGQRFLDVGTGAGLPGIPLAILFPQRRFELLDSNGKKTRFLIEARQRLGLNNVVVHSTRVESLSDDAGFDGILSRAFAALADMVDGCQHVLADGGKMYAMKGQYPDEELSHLPKRFMVEGCHSLHVPGIDEARHLLVLSRSDTGSP